ncbi:MAG: hypothetical protein Q7R95_10960, partial [bacterium]|nr:hypothetical protein [bacterium]
IKFFQYLIGLIMLSPIPAALANTNYSTQRALPLLFLYNILIALGANKILKYVSRKTKIILVILFALFSLVMLWRSYFILFPVEREQAWGGGFEQLSNYIKNNPSKHFVVDSSRGVPYANVYFYLKYKPNNVEFRPINWRNDICVEQVLVGDNLAISLEQINEHYLSKVFEQKGMMGNILWQGYVTNPKLKCQIETNIKR